jgi:hypothetical protein
MKAEEDILMEDKVQELSDAQRIRRQVVHGILDLLGLSDWMTYSKAIQQTFFVLFIVALSILHVYNAHQAEGMTRRKVMIENELKELKWEYMSIKSDLMMRSKLTDIKQILEPTGLICSPQPPFKIVVKADEYQN